MKRELLCLSVAGWRLEEITVGQNSIFVFLSLDFTVLHSERALSPFKLTVKNLNIYFGHNV